MPESIRALIVILILSSFLFIFSKKQICKLIPENDFKRRRNAWYAITIAAFISSNFWIYSLIAIFIIFFSKQRENNIPALYFILLFTLPEVSAQIPGLGLINYLASISHQKILSILILFPAALILKANKNTTPFGRITLDKLIIVFLIVSILFFARNNTLTNVLRFAFFDLTLTIFLPYYVISRSLSSIDRFRETFTSILLVGLILSSVGIIESYKHWLLYKPLLASLDVQDSIRYLPRGDYLRATAIGGHSIAFGYLIAVILGLSFFTLSYFDTKKNIFIVSSILIAGLLSTVSRGPWVGAFFIYLIYTLTGGQILKKLFITFLVLIAVLLISPFVPFLNSMVDLLPFIGETGQGSISYRQRLIENSWIVIQRNPIFGSTNYLDTPEMQEMIQGQNIIDVVNTYIAILLNQGFVGLFIYLTIYLNLILNINRSLKGYHYNDPLHILGRSILATIIGVLIMLATVSSITIVPTVNWSLISLSAAYILLRQKKSDSIS